MMVYGVGGAGALIGVVGFSFWMLNTANQQGKKSADRLRRQQLYGEAPEESYWSREEGL